MKPTTVLHLALIGVAIYGIGCGKKEKVIVAGPPPTGPVELKLKWPVGSQTVQDMDIKQAMEVGLPGQPPMKMDVTMGQKYLYSVLKEHTDGGHDVEMEFLSMRMSIGGGPQPFSFDTAQKENASPSPMSQTFGKLIGTKMTFYLNASNEVFKIDGLDEFQKQVAGAKDPTGISAALFNEGQFRQMIEGQSKGLPPGPVSPGDQWPVAMEVDMGQMGTFITDYKHTFKEWERRNEHNCARIAFEGTMKTKPGQSVQVSGMKMDIHGGKSSGETWFDFERGMTVETILDQDMTVYLTVPANPRQGAAARAQYITNRVHQIITVKAEPKK